jgi:hypothetical protein
MTTPTTIREIVLVHRPYGTRDGGDPAIDYDAPGVSSALSEYQRTRADAARDALPLRPGMTPARFALRRISQSELRWALEAGSPLHQAQRALLVGCHSYIDAQGHEHKTRPAAESTALVAGEDWLDAIGDEFGGAAVAEIGHAVIQWAQAARGALAPFASVPGLVLVR